ncbi:MAG: ImmA/IrrE family metallo-endopeptidase [Solibacillus sp.]|uniref:ImmA/IrrE family metallo-endopeptidase n=1 Tax=Solibacillus sp. TaxID=1909654 RepID=UPI0033151137
MIVKKTAVHLVKRHETNCPFRIAKSKGINIQFQDLGNIWGYYFVYKRVPIIVINSKLSESLQRVVCAHELGHSIFHSNLNTSFMKKTTFFSVDKIELEANRFAAELLIPDEAIAETNDVYQIASLHGVSVELVRLKLICKEELF